MEVILLLPGEGFAKPAFLPAWVLLRTSALNLETEKKNWLSIIKRAAAYSVYKELPHGFMRSGKRNSWKIDKASRPKIYLILKVENALEERDGKAWHKKHGIWTQHAPDFEGSEHSLC